MKIAGPSLTNDNAAVVLQQARQSIVAGDADFDFADVREIDSSAVAVLVALVREARERGTAVSLRNPPPQLRNLAQLYGVDSLLPPAA